MLRPAGQRRHQQTTELAVGKCEVRIELAGDTNLLAG
jgi:hypothetical protein